MQSHTKPISRKAGTLLIGHMAALMSICMWGYSFVSSRVLLDNGLGPVHIYIYRFVLAYMVVLLFSHKRLLASSWRDEVVFLICGLSSGSLYFIAENTALQYTLTTNVALLTSMSPLFTAIFVGLVLKSEKLGIGTWCGSAIAIAGVCCIVLNTSSSLQINPLGDMLSLAAAVCWTVYTLLLRGLNANYDVWFITRKTFFYGLITGVPFLFVETDSAPLMQVISLPAVWGNLLFLGLGASTLAYVTWAVSVRRIGPVKANNYLYFQTIITLVVSWIVLGERITAMGYAGMFLIIAGLWTGDNIGSLMHRLRKRR